MMSIPLCGDPEAHAQSRGLGWVGAYQSLGGFPFMFYFLFIAALVVELPDCCCCCCFFFLPPLPPLLLLPPMLLLLPLEEVTEIGSVPNPVSVSKARAELLIRRNRSGPNNTPPNQRLTWGRGEHTECQTFHVLKDGGSIGEEEEVVIVEVVVVVVVVIK